MQEWFKSQTYGSIQQPQDQRERSTTTHMNNAFAASHFSINTASKQKNRKKKDGTYYLPTTKQKREQHQEALEVYISENNLLQDPEENLRNLFIMLYITYAKIGNNTSSPTSSVLCLFRGSPAFLQYLTDISKMTFIFFSLSGIFKLFCNDCILFL